MSGDLRPGIILTITGILVLTHYFLNVKGPLPRRAELVIGIVLLVVGVPALVIGALAH